MKLKLNVTKNELHALITALRVQKQDLTERLLFVNPDSKTPEFDQTDLMLMFDQTNNVYLQALSYMSESEKTYLSKADEEYLDELEKMTRN